jgi:hypothetical protein
MSAPTIGGMQRRCCSRMADCKSSTRRCNSSSGASGFRAGPSTCWEGDTVVARALHRSHSPCCGSTGDTLQAGIFICFESAFSAHVRALVPRCAGALSICPMTVGLATAPSRKSTSHTPCSGPSSLGGTWSERRARALAPSSPPRATWKSRLPVSHSGAEVAVLTAEIPTVAGSQPLRLVRGRLSTCVRNGDFGGYLCLSTAP